MEKTKTENDKQIHTLKSEEKFFSLIEQRYHEMGYEVLETCGRDPKDNLVESSGNQVQGENILETQGKTIIALEPAYA